MILRLCVVIPTYNNPETISEVVARTLKSCAFPVLVVDDGSEIPVTSLLPPELGRDCENGSGKGRVEVLRLAENQGKGLALQRAISYCLALGFTHIITLDGDAQHFPEDISLLAEEVRKNPWNLVIGERKMDETAPGISHFGRKFSNFWVKYQADAEVRDSQSGYRAYPLFLLQTMRFLTRRYDFEIEVLVRLLWRGAEVSHVPVRVLYQPPGERVSHFGKFRDNARISALNTLLVAVSLCRGRREPLPAALAVGTGVFVGCTPLFGLHTPIVLALAVIFRLNALLLWLGTQISIPPLAPLLAFASVLLGSLVLQRPLDMPTVTNILPFARDSFLMWLTGSLVLGALLGGAAGVAAYVISKRFARRANGKSAKNWTGASRGGRFGNAFLIFVIGKLGLRAGYFCLGFIVPYFHLFAPKARRALNEYWGVREPGLGWLGRQRKAYLHLRTFARVLMDKLYGNHLCSKDPFRRLSNGFENVRGALAEGTGVILVGAHSGSADLGATSMSTHSLGAQLNTLRHESQRHGVDRMAGELGKHIVNVIYVTENDPAIYRLQALLANGEILGLMADRPIDHKFELVPFLGKLAPIATSPFRISLATGAQLVFTASLKAGMDAYQSYAYRPALPPASAQGNRELESYHYAGEYARWLEGLLTRYPDQWFNLYPFFSSPPTLPGGGRCEPRRCYFREELKSKATPLTAKLQETRPVEAKPL